MDAPAYSTPLIPIAIPTNFPVGPVNVFLWKGDPLTLIDVGLRTDEAEAVLAAGLQEQGVQVADIERIILTHHHVDHIGQLRRVSEISGAEAWAHPDVPSQDMPHQRADAERRQFYEEIMAEFGVPEETQREAMALWGAFKEFSEPYTIDRTFEDGGLCGPFRTYFVPGHSATDTLLVNEADGYTIVGDHILETINPNPLLRPPRQSGAPRDKSLVQYQASLRRSYALELGQCYPGHGPRFDDHRKVIDGLLRQHDRRNGKVLNLLGNDESTVFAMSRALYPDLPVQHLYLALSVAAGHLELLEQDGAVHVDRREGVLFYAAADR